MSLKKIRVAVVDYKNIENFETHSFLRRLFDVFLLPLLNNLPKKSRNVIRKTHHSADEVIRYKTTHRALENLYNYGLPNLSRNIFQKFFHSIWFNTANSKAVRNRLKIVNRFLKESIKDLYEKKGSIKILSIASGSARAVIESVSGLGVKNYPNINIYFLDKNPEALEYSRTLAEERGLNREKCSWHEGTATSYLDSLRKSGEKVDLVEMVGLLDYFDDEKVVKTLSLINEILEDGGVLITANINHNKEKKFVTNVIGWEMKYRTHDELIDLLISAGFEEGELDVYTEPFEIHTVVSAKK